MSGISGLYVPPKTAHLSDECLESLYENLNLILESDVCDDNFNYVYAQLSLILHVDDLDKQFLHDFFVTVSSAIGVRPIVTSTSSVQAAMKFFSVERLRGLRKQYNLILQLDDLGGSLDDEQRGILRIDRCVALQMDILEKLVFHTRISQFMLGLNLDTEEVEPLDNKGRHLCISNGFEMRCFHLKPEDAWPVQHAELKLVEEYVAVSAGVFKLGSDAYIIGGLQSDNMEVQSDNADPLKRYTSLCRSYFSDGVEASSRDTCRLSLSSDGASLNRSNCGTLIGQLNKPKFWPIVEKIGGQIHVIDSIPSMLHHYDITPNRKFTHEVLIPGDDTWTEIETIEDDGRYEDKEDYDDYGWDYAASYIYSHLVIGNRIYALADRKYLVFYSKEKKWEATPKNGFSDWKDPLSIRQVRDILELNMAARCVGEFPLGEGREKLYMVIAVCPDWTSCDRKCSYGMLTLAYLVTLAGEVVCFQRLPDQRRLLPSSMRRGTIIEVEDEDEEEGNKAMYCSIVDWNPWGDDGLEFLAINTFQVEALTDNENAGEVGQIWAKGKEVGWPVEHEFVRVVVKDVYEYKLSQQTSQGVKKGGYYFPHMQACFL